VHDIIAGVRPDHVDLGLFEAEVAAARRAHDGGDHSVASPHDSAAVDTR
jgi:hypothetical protein